jgi:hypothetical protein
VYGEAAANYFRWVLRGEEKASEYFLGGLAEADGWKVDSKHLEKVEVTPL